MADVIDISDDSPEKAAPKTRKRGRAAREPSGHEPREPSTAGAGAAGPSAGVAAGGSDGGGGGGSGGWDCGVCTLRNESSAIACVACATSRGDDCVVFMSETTTSKAHVGAGAASADDAAGTRVCRTCGDAHDGDLYSLDACGCLFCADCLHGNLSAQCPTADTPPGLCATILCPLACPVATCKRALTRRDMFLNLTAKQRAGLDAWLLASMDAAWGAAARAFNPAAAAAKRAAKSSKGGAAAGGAPPGPSLMSPLEAAVRALNAAAVALAAPESVSAADAATGPPPRAAKTKAKGRSRGAGSAQPAAWARGTGYGGASDGPGDAAVSRAAAQRAAGREGSRDAALAAATAALAAAIPAAEAASVTGTLPPCCVVAMEGRPALVGTLLRAVRAGDSFLEAESRAGTLMSILGLLRQLSQRAETLPLLLMRPPDDDGAGGGAGPGAAATPPTPSVAPAGVAGTLAGALDSLAQQASVFMKACVATGGGPELDDAAALAATAIACDVVDEADHIRAAVRAWRDSGGWASLPEPGDGGGVGGEEVTPKGKGKGKRGAAKAGGKAKKGRRTTAEKKADADAAEAATTAAERAARNAAESAYVAAVGPHRFDMVPFATTNGRLVHYYRDEAGARAGTGEEANRKRQLRVIKEVSSLGGTDTLPVNWGSSMAVRVDENRNDVMRAIITGPDGTPYQNGFFVFDILLPKDYPDRPPMVHLETTGQGRVRFNPNLYADGKVCLSLLGTWAGPGWEPGRSTLLQVLVSIQAQILVSDPYYNEPGHERSANRPEVQRVAQSYAQHKRWATLEHALLPALRKPPLHFEAFVREHVRHKRAAIEAQLTEWVAEAPQPPPPPAPTASKAKGGAAAGSAGAAAAMAMAMAQAAMDAQMGEGTANKAKMEAAAASVRQAMVALLGANNGTGDSAAAGGAGRA